MEDLKGKVAVITGAASGIGRALAERCVKEGMKVVISDIEVDALKKVEEDLTNHGGKVLSMIVDAARFEDIENLAKRTIEKFGRVDLLFNNAGVSVPDLTLSQTISDYKWILSVNFWGVMYGVKVFLPIMIAQDSECRIINTASGYAMHPGAGSYGIAKYGVRTMTEQIAAELVESNPKIKLSLIIPGWVNTKIVTAERNRQEKFKNPDTMPMMTPEMEKEIALRVKEIMETMGNAQTPEFVADVTFNGIKNDLFYIFTDLGLKEAMMNYHNNAMKYFDEFEKYMKKKEL